MWKAVAIGVKYMLAPVRRTAMRQDAPTAISAHQKVNEKLLIYFISAK
jgi:hypothetical protein